MTEVAELLDANNVFLSYATGTGVVVWRNFVASREYEKDREFPPNLLQFMLDRLQYF